MQVSIRMPFWYREQLLTEAALERVSVPQLIMDILQRQIKPNPPR